MARRWRKTVSLAALAIFVLLLVGITFTIGWRPIIGAKARTLTDRSFEATPARLERGRYLVEGVLGCFDCHSERDPNVPGAPYMPDKKGAGVIFFDGGDFPGRLVAANITPDRETGAGNWSDDALARAIREGIGHDGRALFPLMPYGNYRQLSDEDLAAVIAYVRSVPPVRNALPETEIGFPLKYLIRNAPQPITAPVPEADVSEPIRRGSHLATLASCSDCHTPMERGQPKAGLEMGGGFIFDDFVGKVASANITPDSSGISYYDEKLFLEVMRTGQVKARKLSPIMPWGFYRNMTDEDLKAIYAYIRTLKPVKHTVDNTEPPTDCKLCGNKHGAGDRN